MPGLFGGSLFGKQAPTQGLDPDQAQSLGIIQAMQQSQQAGMQRTASPMGSIAQNLLPIFAAMIYSKAAQAQSEQQAQKNAIDTQTKQAQLAVALANAQKVPGEIAKNEAETKRITAETDYRQRLLNNPALAQIFGGGGQPADAATGDAAPAPTPVSGSPEVDIKDNPEAQKFFSQTKEKYPGMSAEEMMTLYDAKQGKPGGSTGGSPSPVLSGLRPKVTLGITGPGISYSSDVKSPERQKQDMEVAAAAKAQTLRNEKDLASFKASLPKALSDKDKLILANGSALEQLMDNAEEMAKTVPADMTDKDYAWNAMKYQGRAKSPEGANFLKSFGVDTSNDPRLDPWFSYLGQVRTALSGYAVQGKVGGIRLLQFLQNHFPNEADSKAQALSKIKQLNEKKSFVRTQLSAINDQFLKAGNMVDSLPPETGAQAVDGFVRMPWVDQQGKQHFMMIDPTTGQASNAE